MSAIRPMPQSDPYFQEAQEAARDCKIQLPSLSQGVDKDRIVRLVRQKINELALQGHAKAEHHKRRFEMLDLEDGMQKLNITIPPAGEDQLPDAFPPEVVGIIFSYLPPEADVTLPSVLATLSVNSDLARRAALLTRDSANKATAAANQTLLNILSQVIGGTTPEPDSATASALAHVDHAEGLNALFQRCTSANMLEQVILFLATHCPDLRQLDLSRVKNLGPSHLLLLSRFRLLHTLSLARTFINDTHVEALKGLPLKTLHLNNTSITGTTLHTLSRGIQELNLSFCTRLTDEGIEGLGEKEAADGKPGHAAMQLVKCDLSNTLITGSTLHTLARGIKKLNLRCCKRLTDEGVRGLGEKEAADGKPGHAAMKLVECDLSNTHITGSTLHTLSREIQKLNLTICEQLTDEGVRGLGEKEAADGKPGHAAMQLVECDLSFNSITGSTFRTLSRGIQKLNLRYCRRLTDEAIEGLGEKKAADGKPGHAAMKLVECDLGSTLITGTRFHSLYRGIQDLDLASCSRLTDEGVHGLLEKKDGAGKVLWQAMQLVRCVLPDHINETLRAQLPA